MDKIIRDAKKYCTRLLTKSRCSRLPFHNLEHTTEVYNNTMKIGIYQNVPIEALEPVLLAALFHDTGNAEIFKNHENFSIRHAMKFLQEKDYPHTKIATVIDCIGATRVPQKPNDILEKIICDADLFHLGTHAFHSKNKALRREWNKFLEIDYKDRAWLELNIDFLSKHRFHTQYGREILEPVKQENLRTLKLRLKELESHKKENHESN